MLARIRPDAMTRLILVLLALTALAMAVIWLAEIPGGVGIDLPGWRVEISLFGAAFLAGGALAVLFWIGRLWGKIGTWIAANRHRRELRRHDQALALLTRGYLAAAAGDGALGLRSAEAARTKLGEQPLIELLAAQSAQLMGDRPAADRALAALAARPESALAGVRGLLNFARADGEQIESLRLARRAVELQPEAPWTLPSLYEIELAEGDFAAAETTLKRMRHYGRIAAEAARRQLAHLHMARAKLVAPSDVGAALALAKSALKSDPGFVPALAFAAEAKAQLGQARRAWWALERGWKAGPHPELAASFWKIFKDAPPEEQLTRAQKLKAAQPEHAESRLLVAEAALAAGNLTLAREMLEGLEIKGARACRLLASLDEKQYGDTAGARAQQALADEAPGEPGWTCSACAKAAGEWQAKCPACGAFASLTWCAPGAAAEHATATRALPAPVLPAI